MTRHLLKLVLLLLVGAVINAAVAFACAMWAPLQMEPGPFVHAPTDADVDWWRKRHPQGTAADVSAVWHISGLGCQANMMMGDRSRSAMIRNEGEQTIFGAMAGSLMDRAVTVRAGLPLKSVGGEHWDFKISLATPIPMPGMRVTTSWRPADLHVSAISFDRPELLGESSFRVLGWRPIWPGFAVNTLLYAAMLWLLATVAITVRAHLRRGGGLCPACAYPVGDSPVCTECGKSVKPKHVEVAA